MRKLIPVAAALALIAAPALASQPPDDVSPRAEMSSTSTDLVDSESVTRADWSEFMLRHPAPEEGCFQASYPNIDWERVDCAVGQPRTHPTPVKRKD